MKELKHCILDYNTTPTLDDIKQCIFLAKSTDTVVKLEWDVKWSGHYSRLIRADDDPQDIYDNHIPHIYGM